MLLGEYAPGGVAAGRDPQGGAMMMIRRMGSKVATVGQTGLVAMLGARFASLGKYDFQFHLPNFVPRRNSVSQLQMEVGRSCYRRYPGSTCPVGFQWGSRCPQR